MAKTQPTGKQLKDTTIERDDLNVAGAAGTTVVAKIVQGNDGILLSSTGTDAGTGDVTISGKAMVGATSIAAGKLGDVPAPSAGQQNYFLRGDATWVVAPGTGTVTSVSIVTANGVSGTVATPSTTPAITIALGAITPTSVAVTTAGTTGSNITVNGSNAAGSPSFAALNDLGQQCEMGIRGSTRATYGTLVAGDGYLYTAQPLTIVSDGSVIKFANSGATERMRMGNGLNIGGTTDPGATNLSVAGSVAIGGGTPILKVISATVTVAVGVITAGSRSVTTVSMPGIQNGDFIAVSPPIGSTWNGLVFYASYDSVDIARLIVMNTLSVSSANVGSATYRLTAFRI